MTGLREALEEAVNGGSLNIEEHPAAIAQLASRFPHSIRHVEGEPERPYNCYMLVLALLDNDRVYEILQKDADWYGTPGVKVGPEYVSRLIQRGILTRDESGQVLIYCRNGKPAHAGILAGERVQSKWGRGLLWEHAVWEVPSSYGDIAERYRVVRPDLLEPEFAKYAAPLFAAKGIA